MKKAAMLLTMLFIAAFLRAEEITIDNFIQTAVKNDPAFQEILADMAQIKYSKALALPAEDLILSVKGQYGFSADTGETGAQTTDISLSKLFLPAGTRLNADYSIITAGSSNSGGQSSFHAYISQPLAENAFGSADRMLAEIQDYAMETAEYQTIEAYEEYLASIIKLYFSWYSNHAALKAAEAALKESNNLIDNITEKKEAGIAYEMDVNKARLQNINRKENLIRIKQQYTESENLIKTALRTGNNITPSDPGIYNNSKIPSEINEDRIYEKSRTKKILELLSKKAGVSEARAFNSLLPGVDMTAGYKTDGSGAFLRAPAEHTYYTGFRIDFPVPFSGRNRAEFETAKLEKHKTELRLNRDSLSLAASLSSVFSEIQSGRKIAELAKEKHEIALKILNDEKQYFNRTRSSFNSLIDAVNAAEDARFREITARMNLNNSILDFMRLSDTLVKELKP
ncbi:MAG: TolC family protein [Candidatus Goldiibacteriota bacterium]